LPAEAISTRGGDHRWKGIRPLTVFFDVHSGGRFDVTNPGAGP